MSKKKKNLGGRPRKAPADLLSVGMRFAVRPAEAAAIRAAAEARGISVSTFMYRAVLPAAGVVVDRLVPSSGSPA